MRRLVYIAIALSGLTALGSEVVWTRMLSLLFGATTYTFSLILAVFLVGLGIGSSLGSAMARNLSNPRIALGWCQLGLCVCLAWAAYATSVSLPYWPINPSISTSLMFNFQLDLMRAIWVMLPGAILWGASFPLALASVAGPGQDSGRLVGGVYAANTVGAIVGAVVVSLVLVGTVGSQTTQQVLIGVAAMSGLLMLMPTAGERRSPGGVHAGRRDRDRARRRPAGPLRGAASRGSSSPTAGMRRRGSGRTKWCTSAKA